MIKNKILLFFSLLTGGVLFVVACTKTEDDDSQVQPTSVPYIAISYLQDVYIYGQGNTSIYSDLPNVLAIAVDSASGFEGGYGGKTGKDSLKILKSDIAAFGDTVSVGGSSFSIQKFNRGNFRTSIGANIVIAATNDHPGPTALEGTYVRTTNSYPLQLVKVDDGIYLLNNPGGSASVGPNPYLLYSYKSSGNSDSLSFAVQTDLCHGGLQLVDPNAPPALTSAAYTAQYPPQITSYAPLTLSWKVLEFPAASPSSLNAGAVLCNWGLGARTFVKQ